MELVNEQLAEGVHARAELVDGKIVLTTTLDVAVGIDKLKELVPGKIDDAILDVVKMAVKSV